MGELRELHSKFEGGGLNCGWDAEIEWVSRELKQRGHLIGNRPPTSGPPQGHVWAYCRVLEGVASLCARYPVQGHLAHTKHPPSPRTTVGPWE